ncbi:unknown [Clostridium sp. CAG:448]|nr:unknown [Clostridium sp. CAG:448]
MRAGGQVQPLPQIARFSAQLAQRGARDVIEEHLFHCLTRAVGPVGKSGHPSGIALCGAAAEVAVFKLRGCAQTAVAVQIGNAQIVDSGRTAQFALPDGHVLDRREVISFRPIEREHAVIRIVRPAADGQAPFQDRVENVDVCDLHARKVR